MRTVIKKVTIHAIEISVILLFLSGISLPWMIPILYNAIFGPFEINDAIIQSALQDEKTAASRSEESYLPVYKNKIASIFRLGCYRAGMKFYFKAPETFYTISYPSYHQSITKSVLEDNCQEIYQTRIGYILAIGAHPRDIPQSDSGFIVNFDKKNIQYIRDDIRNNGKILLWKTDPDMSDEPEKAAYIENPEEEILPIAFYNRIWTNILLVGGGYAYIFIFLIVVIVSVRNIIVSVQRIRNYERHPIFKGIEDKGQFLRELQHAKVEKRKVITENWLLYDRFFYIKRYKRSRYFK